MSVAAVAAPWVQLLPFLFLCCLQLSQKLLQQQEELKKSSSAAAAEAAAATQKRIASLESDLE